MNSSDNSRQYWTEIAERIARPVLTALANNQLRATMPVEIAPHNALTNRPEVSHIAAGLARDR